MKKYSLADVNKHNTEDNCWVLIDNQIFDVSNYLDKHPGGKKIILKFAGTDCTDVFLKIHGKKNFKDLLKPFYIGDLDT